MHPQSTPTDPATFEPSLCFLGLLCVRRHEWQGTGLSLRYLSTRQCIECLRESVRIGRERPDYRLSDAEFALLLGRREVRLRVYAQLWGNLAGESDAECWVWQGRAFYGYGNITIRLRGRTKTMRAHRLAFLLAHGSLPPHPLVIRHVVCDNPLCCNPAHLAAGTNAENVADKVARNRQARGPRAHPEWAARGERSGNARWTEAQILEMRQQRAAGQTLAAIAAAFGTTKTKVHEIVTGQAWAHVRGALTPVASTQRKLNAEKVGRVWAMYADGIGPTRIAEAMNVSTQSIRWILARQTWKKYAPDVQISCAKRSSSEMP